MKHDRAIRAEEADESLAQAIDRARDSYARGEGVEHRVFGEWLQTWRSGQSRPFKDWLAAWDG